jgi:sulfonate transport system permease protein
MAVTEAPVGATTVVRAPEEARSGDVQAPRQVALVRPDGRSHRRTPRRPIPRQARRLIGPIVALGLWQLICSLGMVSSIEVASPIAVFDAGRELWSEGQLQSNLLISLQRVGEGLLLGVGAGLTLAVICGLFHLGEDLLDPVIQAARSVPILGLVPLVIIWFGVGEAPKVFLIALGCTFPVYLNTYAAIRGVDVKLVEAGQTFGLGRWGLITKVILPGTLPGFLVGLRFALVGSWLVVVVAEEINAHSGIGYLINQAQTWGRTDIIMLGLAIYAILGLIADAIVRFLEYRLLGWRRGFTGS